MNHPWELSPQEMQSIPELNQFDPIVQKPNRIKNYLLNSGENPNSNLRNNNGSDFSNQELETMTVSPIMSIRDIAMALIRFMFSPPLLTGSSRTAACRSRSDLS